MSEGKGAKEPTSVPPSFIPSSGRKKIHAVHGFLPLAKRTEPAKRVSHRRNVLTMHHL